MPHATHQDFNHFDIQQGSQGIVTLARRIQGMQEQTNYMDILEQFADICTNILIQPHIKGLIYTSPLLPHEADYKEIYNSTLDVAHFEKRLSTLLYKALDLHKIGKPIIGIIQGACSGVALSLTLWASHRIAVANATLGFLDSKYGLFPGFGGTVMTSYIAGALNTIPLLTQSKVISAQDAIRIGIVDKIAASTDEAALFARDLIQNATPQMISIGQLAEADREAIENSIRALKKRWNGLNPGIAYGLELTQNTLDLSLEDTLIQEIKRYIEVWRHPEVISMLRTQYYGVREASQQLTTLPPSLDYKPRKIGVLGAGMMGSGIAYEAARSKMEVILKDTTLKQAQLGKMHADSLCRKLIEQGHMDERSCQELLSRIHPTQDDQDLKEADLIIEAVYEDKKLKAEVTLSAMPLLHNNGFFASNTTSLPITELASVTASPQHFIGMHFFSPVDRMALVEIIRGKYTSDETEAKALYIARLLHKIPIVVNDGPGFYTSRIFFNYLLEGIIMLLEGIPASQIEQEARLAGFAIGPLAVLDEISLALMLHVYDQFPSLHATQQRCYDYLNNLIASGRNGRKSGKGFYDYSIESGVKTIWQDSSIFTSHHIPSGDIIQKRLLHIVAIDAYRCLENNILQHPIDGDIGSILGIGYPAHTGGVFSHIDQVGLKSFVKECSIFAPHGEQWEIPTSLITLADRDFKFYSNFDSNW
ncbi:3-hydroxyacyl-CoA dehydrogenase NAD-binding domain-containing protein [Sphingobacterium sp. SYP-B4668]|uniref:3-hydroxyacyl-CoA dehydrogenase NAD-binding domain-containing protein n=1 Tax=Sphingobacterium sp. SYP-B4668 TaxID=2996035 RepID=UPI0022DD15DC|nr:3-hydroxyacyl-CoA dehydrogenase NAD-binding domain-containing protein [Sphingobacterium sp. SYP-B4668]